MFELADGLVTETYRRTRAFPKEERFGLTSQIRRAAVSVPTNIVEGCNRRSTRDYLHFLVISLGSASELRYLLAVSCRLGFLPEPDFSFLDQGYGNLVRALQRLIDTLDTSRSLKPEA